MLFFTLNFLYCLSNMFYDFLETQINMKSRGRPTPEKINSIGELLQKGRGEGGGGCNLGRSYEKKYEIIPQELQVRLCFIHR